MMIQPEAYVSALILERDMRARDAQLRAQVRAVRRRRLAETRAGVIRRILAGVR
jgi:hypothetical protein